ncbi:hypothetical protein D3C71_793790 [compost metagenome]
MPDSNPKLTASLHRTRDVLLGERNDILNRIAELHSVLDMNSTQIEAADTLMLRFDPEHISIDVRTDLQAAPMLVVKRPLQLASSTAIEAIPSAVEAASEQPPKAHKAAKTTKAKAKKAAKPTKTAKAKAHAKEAAPEAAAEPSATEPAAGEQTEKAQRSPARQAISEYFHRTRRNDTILKILSAKDEPVNAATIASDYKALYPLPDDSAELKTLHNSRISAALHYLKDRGQAIRVEMEEGKHGESIRWELSKSYRSELRKGRKITKANGHSFAPAAQSAESVSATAH